MTTLCRQNRVKIRNTNSKDIEEIHTVLYESFTPYREYYTEEAFDVTVVYPHEILKRINNKQSEVFVTIFENRIIGTATIELHICSVVVKPEYQKKGIGHFILEEISRIAKRKHARTLSLDCFSPLIEAFNLYKKFGFQETGRKKDLLEIEIFAMKKRIY